MNIQNDNSEAVNRFYLVAQHFCSLVDSADTVDKTEFSVRIYRALPELIGEAMRLPREELSDDDEVDEDVDAYVYKVYPQARVTHEEWSRLFNTLKEKLGDWNSYWQVFDPTEDEDKEAIYGSLADDIAGVYGDLKEGINLKDGGEAAPEDIIFKRRLGFYTHWGKHAIDALRTIHFRVEETLTE